MVQTRGNDGDESQKKKKILKSNFVGGQRYDVLNGEQVYRLWEIMFCVYIQQCYRLLIIEVTRVMRGIESSLAFQLMITKSLVMFVAPDASLYVTKYMGIYCKIYQKQYFYSYIYIYVFFCLYFSIYFNICIHHVWLLIHTKKKKTEIALFPY